MGELRLPSLPGEAKARTRQKVPTSTTSCLKQSSRKLLPQPDSCSQTLHKTLKFQHPIHQMSPTVPQARLVVSARCRQMCQQLTRGATQQQLLLPASHRLHLVVVLSRRALSVSTPNCTLDHSRPSPKHKALPHQLLSSQRCHRSVHQATMAMHSQPVHQGSEDGVAQMVLSLQAVLRTSCQLRRSALVTTQADGHHNQTKRLWGPITKVMEPTVAHLTRSQMLVVRRTSIILGAARAVAAKVGTEAKARVQARVRTARTVTVERLMAARVETRTNQAMLRHLHPQLMLWSPTNLAVGAVDAMPRRALRKHQSRHLSTRASCCRNLAMAAATTTPF